MTRLIALVTLLFALGCDSRPRPMSDAVDGGMSSPPPPARDAGTPPVGTEHGNGLEVGDAKGQKRWRGHRFFQVPRISRPFLMSSGQKRPQTPT